MTPAEGDEIYGLVTRLFQGVDTERAYRVRSRLMASGLIANTARELLFQHRETQDYLTETALYAAVERFVNPAADAAERGRKVAKEAAERRRRDQDERRQIEASWDKVRQWLARQPAEKLAAWKAAALGKLPEFQRVRLAEKSLGQSPTLDAMIAAEAKAERAAGAG